MFWPRWAEMALAGGGGLACRPSHRRAGFDADYRCGWGWVSVTVGPAGRPAKKVVGIGAVMVAGRAVLSPGVYSLS